MTEIYRDGTEGAAAKRQELLRRRRDELVTMPHAVRRVVVARSARIAAGTAITLAGICLVAAVATPRLATWMTSWLPGIQPAPLSTLLSAMWIVGLIAWAIGRARVEHHFAVAMSRYVLPGSDLDHDIERLDHERPDEIARAMAHRLEVRSAAWPVVAAALLLPATALYVGLGVRSHGWPVMSEFELSLAAHSSAVVIIAIAGCLAAVAMTRRSMRLPLAAPIFGGLAFAACVATIGLFARHSSLEWWATGAMGIFGSIALIAYRLRVERTLIAAEDPAAGSELFTIRGFLRSVRSSAASVGRAIRGLRGYKVWRFGIVAALAGAGFYAFTKPAHRSEASAQMAVEKPGAVMPHSAANAPTLDTSGYKITRVGTRFEIDMTIENGGLDIPSLSDLGMVPTDWGASVAIELGSGAENLAITPYETNVAPVYVTASTRGELQLDNCDGRVQPLGLHVTVVPAAGLPEAQNGDASAKKVTIYVTPTLSVARCDAKR